MKGPDWSTGQEIVVAWHHKGVPASAVGQPVQNLRGASLLQNELPTPVLVLRDHVLEDNLTALHRWCALEGIDIAPHVKTTMSPQIIARQLAHGSWAVTVATPVQARTVRAVGAARILLANEIVDPDGIAWLVDELNSSPEFDAYCYVDSRAGAELIAEHLRAQRLKRPLPVLVEVGTAAGRAGEREVTAIVELAAHLHDSPCFSLSGVGGFEGVLGTGDDSDPTATVRSYLTRLRDVADQLYDWRDRSEFIVTAGGSAYLELIPGVFDRTWRAGRAVRVVVRSGCYVTHDSGAYELLRQRLASHVEVVPLRPALELWSSVLSVPEPDLAILDFGRRDVGTDAGYPAPLHLARRGGRALESAPEIEVTALNDQHAYARPTSDQSLELEVGDRVVFGISHPCTVLDKWRLIPVVDTERRLVGAVETLF